MSFRSPTTYSISKKFAIFQGFTGAKLTKKFIAPEFNYKPKYPIQIALVSAGKEPNPDIFTCLMENGSCIYVKKDGIMKIRKVEVGVGGKQ